MSTVTNTIAEAMSCETPVIATSVGDAASIIGDPQWIVSPQDPKELATAVNRAIEEPSMLKDGESLRESIIDRYSITVLGERTSTYLRRLVSDRY